MTLRAIHIVGGGLAGSEAAWQAAEAGAEVVLHEMRPVRRTDAHQTDRLAELVCSNSFRADDWEANAVGLLHAEMRRAGSLIMACADAHQTPAGGALAVDREGFAEAVTRALEAHPRIRIERGEVAGLPPPDWTSVIVATGPLTSPALAEAIGALTGEAELQLLRRHRPDRPRRDDRHGPRLAPVALRQGRSRRRCGRLHQLPDGQGQYEAFVDALLAGPKSEFKDWEHVPYFDGCLPIEVMAERGRETLRFGPMKPVGLTNPHRPDEQPHAVVQLRQDNALGTLWNMVGFQTKLKHGAQTEIFRTIPGLQKAVFARLGGLHRNTFINAPKLLDRAAAPEGRAAPALRRPDHRRRGLCRERRDRPRRRAPGRRRAARPRRSRRRRRPRRWAPSCATSPAATWPPARARSSR